MGEKGGRKTGRGGLYGQGRGQQHYNNVLAHFDRAQRSALCCRNASQRVNIRQLYNDKELCHISHSTALLPMSNIELYLSHLVLSDPPLYSGIDIEVACLLSVNRPQWVKTANRIEKIQRRSCNYFVRMCPETSEIQSLPRQSHLG